MPPSSLCVLNGAVPIAAIERFIDGWSDRCHPFVWTKTADGLLDHCWPGQKHRLYDASTSSPLIVGV